MNRKLIALSAHSAVAVSCWKTKATEEVAQFFFWTQCKDGLEEQGGHAIQSEDWPSLSTAPH